jgi:hypothetical protein
MTLEASRKCLAIIDCTWMLTTPHVIKFGPISVRTVITSATDLTAMSLFMSAADGCAIPMTMNVMSRVQSSLVAESAAT